MAYNSTEGQWILVASKVRLSAVRLSAETGQQQLLNPVIHPERIGRDLMRYVLY